MPKTIMVTETGTDLNDYKEEGIYCFPNSSYTPANIPIGVNGWLIVLPSTSGTTATKQIWYRFGSVNSNSYQTFERLFYNGTWGDWTQYMTVKGGTFTGMVTLAGDPTAALHAATKQYADTKIAKSAYTLSGTTLTINF